MSSPDRTNRRACPRYPVGLDVRVSLDDGTELVGLSFDIGLGGMRVATTSALEFGSSVTLRFRLPELDHDTVVRSVVRWVGDDNTAGVQFGSLRARDVWALNQLFRKG